MSQILMPGVFLHVLTAITRGSIGAVKSGGDSGQPCLVECCKMTETVLLVNTLAIGLE